MKGSWVCPHLKFFLDKTAVMDVTGLLCVSLGSRTVQLHGSLGSKRACACSEAGFSCQNGDLSWGVYYRRTEFCSGQRDSMQKIYIKKCFLFMAGSVYHIKWFTTGLRKFYSHRWCPTRSPCWDCDRRNCAAGGRVGLIWQEDNNSVATALVCSHGLA
jgi:hypothetical protein